MQLSPTQFSEAQLVGCREIKCLLWPVHLSCGIPEISLYHVVFKWDIPRYLIILYETGW